MSKVIIKSLRAKCIIGVNASERENPQEVLVDIELKLDLAKSASSDKLSDSVDYYEISNKVEQYIKDSKFYLLEKLAGELAIFIKEMTGAESVKVTVKKPEALDGADYAAVELEL